MFTAVLPKPRWGRPFDHRNSWKQQWPGSKWVVPPWENPETTPQAAESSPTRRERTDCQHGTCEFRSVAGQEMKKSHRQWPKTQRLGGNLLANQWIVVNLMDGDVSFWSQVEWLFWWGKIMLKIWRSCSAKKNNSQYFAFLIHCDWFWSCRNCLYHSKWMCLTCFHNGLTWKKYLKKMVGLRYQDIFLFVVSRWLYLL